MTEGLGSGIFEGWHLEEEHIEEWDDRVTKIYHTALHQDGRRVFIDWSPYRGISNRDFKRLVVLGFPDRQHSLINKGGPLNTRDLELIWREQDHTDTFDNEDTLHPVAQQLLNEPITSLPLPPDEGRVN